MQTRSSGKGEEVQLCCQSVETCRNATTHRDRTSWPWMETCAKQHSGDLWFEGSQNPMDIRFSSSDVEDYDTSADEDLGYNSSSDEEVDFLEF